MSSLLDAFFPEVVLFKNIVTDKRYILWFVTNMKLFQVQNNFLTKSDLSWLFGGICLMHKHVKNSACLRHNMLT